MTTAEHTATMRYLMNAFMFWLISILPPFSFVTRRRISERISSLSGGFPFGFILFRRFSSKRFEGLVAGLGVWFDEFWFEFSFPVRKVIFQRFLNHDAKIRHSSYPVVRCRAMSCDAGTFSLKFPKILPFSLF